MSFDLIGIDRSYLQNWDYPERFEDYGSNYPILIHGIGEIEFAKAEF